MMMVMLMMVMMVVMMMMMMVVMMMMTMMMTMMFTYINYKRGCSKMHIICFHIDQPKRLKYKKKSIIIKNK
jgi:hypothetical protein